MTAREPLLLLPGLLCDARLWTQQVAHLADIAETMVARIPPVDSMAALAEAVLAQAPPRFALAGLSMGGYLAFEIVRRAPERVSRLALLDTSARADTPEQTETRKDLVRIAKTGGFSRIAGQLLPAMMHPGHAIGSDLKAGVVAMAEGVGAETFVHHQTAMMGRPDSRPDLPGITVPTLVLVGAEDLDTPAELHREIAAGIGPNAKLVIVDDSGHLSPLEQPQAVTAVMRYWLQT